MALIPGKSGEAVSRTADYRTGLLLTIFTCRSRSTAGDVLAGAEEDEQPLLVRMLEEEEEEE
jgi:hypothetical protein